MPRIVATALAVTMMSVAVAGCGGSSAAGGSRDTSRPVTKAQAARYAHAVNLRAGDILEMSTSGRETESVGASGKRSDEELSRCAGAETSEHQLVDIKSVKFLRGEGLEHEEISSGVSVMSNALFASRELASVRSARGRACLLRFAKRQFERGVGPLRAGRVTTSLLNAPLAGIRESFGLRVSVTLIMPRIKAEVPFYLDFLGFVAGPAEIDLQDFAFSRPVARSTEHQLLLMLSSRAKATRL